MRLYTEDMETRDHVLKKFGNKKERNTILITLVRRIKQKCMTKPEATLKQRRSQGRGGHLRHYKREAERLQEKSIGDWERQGSKTQIEESTLEKRRDISSSKATVSPAPRTAPSR